MTGRGKKAVAKTKEALVKKRAAPEKLERPAKTRKAENHAPAAKKVSAAPEKAAAPPAKKKGPAKKKAEPPAPAAAATPEPEEAPTAAAASPASEAPSDADVPGTSDAPATSEPQVQVAGQLFVLGEGDCGQLGRGEDITEASRPMTSLDGTQVKQVACGGMHTAVLAESGTVFTTGVNDEGALGRKTGGEAWEKGGAGIPGAVGDQYIWAPVQFPDEASPIVQLSAGDSHSVALDDEGQVFAWGTFRSDAGVFGFLPDTRIALLPTLVLKPASAAEQVIKICSGTDHVLALRRDGSVMSWGTGFMGQLGRIGPRICANPDGRAGTQLHPAPVTFGARHRTMAKTIVDMGAGNYSSYAISAKGHVFSWGLNNYGQLGLTTKGPAFLPQLVKDLTNKGVVEIQGGEHHTLARTQDGTILSCGRPTYGRLGRTGEGVDVHGDAACAKPGLVAGLDDAPVHSVCAGGSVSACVAGEPPRAYFWGMGTTNQLGKGPDDDADELQPKKLSETKKLQHRSVLQVAIGGQHAALIAGPQQQ